MPCRAAVGDVERLLTAKQVAAQLGVCLRTFDRHAGKEIPFVMIGTARRYDPKDVEKWLEARKAGVSGETRRPASTTSAGRSTVAMALGPQQREKLLKLREKRRASTREP